jgi:hypothetical protein
MSRYNENQRNREMSTFAHVTLGILTAVLILTAAGGLLIYLNGKAEERQLLMLVNELITKPAKEAAIQREQRRVANEIARQNAIRAAEAAAREKEAFRNWYKKPERCEAIADQETRVFCANSYMRARKQWEEIKIAAGE